jgi:hypothetical protein
VKYTQADNPDQSNGRRHTVASKPLVLAPVMLQLSAGGRIMREIMAGAFALVFLMSCTATAISHDEDMAAKSAVEFAKVALIEHDIQSSYSLLSENAKKMISFEKYSQAIAQTHPSLYPKSLTADEFEPMPGQKSMYIFLHGENGSEKFYYRFTMEGTARTGYKVLGIYRGDGPYPPSRRRQKLKTPYST